VKWALILNAGSFAVSFVCVRAIRVLLTGVIARRVAPPQIFWIALISCGVSLIAFARATALPAAIVVAAVIGLGSGAFNSAISPIILSVTPSRLLGRVSAVICPMTQLASIVSMALAGFLASTVLRGFHRVIGGAAFGPYDTVLAFGGLLFVVAGLASIAPMRSAGAAAPMHAASALPAADGLPAADSTEAAG
jgi:hypothetical protein